MFYLTVQKAFNFRLNHIFDDGFSCKYVGRIDFTHRVQIIQIITVLYGTHLINMLFSCFNENNICCLLKYVFVLN